LRSITYCFFRYFDATTQKFLVTGHTFLPCDRLFALIEKKKKQAQAFVPSQWLEIISEARPNRPFVIQLMNREDMKNFGILLERLPRPATFKVTNYCLITQSYDQPGQVSTKTSHSELENYTVHLYVQPNILGRNSPAWEYRFFINGIDFRNKYISPIPVSDKKYSDLLKMSNYLEFKYRSFYVELPHCEDVDSINF